MQRGHQAQNSGTPTHRCLNLVKQSHIQQSMVSSPNVAAVNAWNRKSQSFVTDSASLWMTDFNVDVRDRSMQTKLHEAEESGEVGSAVDKVPQQSYTGTGMHAP